MAAARLPLIVHAQLRACLILRLIVVSCPRLWQSPKGLKQIRVQNTHF
jgi:hypothetical protein